MPVGRSGIRMHNRLSRIFEEPRSLGGAHTEFFEDRGRICYPNAPGLFAIVYRAISGTEHFRYRSWIGGVHRSRFSVRLALDLELPPETHHETGERRVPAASAFHRA